MFIIRLFFAEQNIFRSFIMNATYAKCLLFAYPHLLELSEQIDTIVEKRALSSMTNFKPCITLCDEILDLTEQKKNFLKIYLILNKIVEKLSFQEKIYLDYKYFKKLSSADYEGYDFSSRNYFRKQIKLVNKIAEQLEKEGIDDGFFLDKLLSTDFFAEMLKRVKDYEIKSYKNKPLQEKLARASLISREKTEQVIEEKQDFLDYSSSNARIA